MSVLCSLYPKVPFRSFKSKDEKKTLSDFDSPFLFTLNVIWTRYREHALCQVCQEKGIRKQLKRAEIEGA